ncbi:transposase [Methanosarcina barkeri]|uniref:Insertion element IS402-like domain-containing protein n=1 Tax=Methanosarcina barkeri (strain Fusaro / DSM 804) TaxID=269797 RepID=Q46EP6_METBF
MSFRDIDGVLWNSIEPYLPPQKPHTGRSRANMRKLMNGIFYVVMTGCTWKDVPRRYGSKSTVHRFLLYLCEHGIYQKIFNELLNKGYDLKKIDFSHCFTDTKDIPAKKGKYRLRWTQKNKRNKNKRFSRFTGFTSLDYH